MKTFNCCICGLLFEGFGNNPQGAMWKTENGEIYTPTFKEGDRCCEDCNARYVLPGRLYQIYKERENVK